MKSSFKRRLGQFLFFISIVSLASHCFAQGGKVTYPDGSPAAGAQVIVSGGGQGKTVVACDSEGRFELDSIPENALVRIKADSKDFAPLMLPASLFTSGDLAIVLQPKETKSKSKK